MYIHVPFERIYRHSSCPWLHAGPHGPTAAAVPFRAVLPCRVRNYQQALQTLRSITGVSKQKHSRASAEVTRLTGELRDVNSNLQSVFTQLRCAPPRCAAQREASMPLRVIVRQHCHPT